MCSRSQVRRDSSVIVAAQREERRASQKWSPTPSSESGAPPMKARSCDEIQATRHSWSTSAAAQPVSSSSSVTRASVVEPGCSSGGVVMALASSTFELMGESNRQPVRKLPDSEVAPGAAAPREDGRAVRGRATRAAVLRAARELFAERGYADVGTNEVVERAGATRGALYHHFEDKRALFRAVYEELEQEVAEQIVAAVAREPRTELHLEVGVNTFLDVCLEPAHRRISLIEAPSVLGHQEWRGIGAEYSLGLLRAALDAAMQAGVLEPQPVDTLAHLMLGALAEAALMLARADDLEVARAEVGRTVARLHEGLAPRSSTLD